MMQPVSMPRVVTPSPLKAVTAGAPRRVGLVNDYLRIPYANGSSFASQFLFRELEKRGHDVTVIGPRDPSARPDQLPAKHVAFSSLPMRNHPGLYMPLPDAAGLREVASLELDALIAQVGSGFMAIAPWLRLRHRVPSLCVNTLHLPSVYDAVLPESLQDFMQTSLVPWVMSHVVRVYNQTDGLVVLSSGLRDYWRSLGVKAPIHVIPRAVDPSIFDGPVGEDPFDPRAQRGGRLLVVCRHTREKEVARLLRIFARRIAPSMPQATLTLVGDGPDHDAFKKLAEDLGVADRTFFLGEFPVTSVRNFYHHADAFVYTSLSETYGQVISEALWCGLPVVAFDDQKGVRDQVRHGIDGMLVAPGPNKDAADEAFAAAACAVLREPLLRRRLGDAAARGARTRCSTERCVDAWQEALGEARDHCHETMTQARPLASVAPLVQWRSMHYLTFAMGLLRAPTELNRHQRGQPGWTNKGESSVGSERPAKSA